MLVQLIRTTNEIFLIVGNISRCSDGSQAIGKVCITFICSRRKCFSNQFCSKLAIHSLQ